MPFVGKGKPKANCNLSRAILFSSRAAFRCPVPRLTYLHALGILLHHSPAGCALHPPAGAQRVPAERPLRAAAVLPEAAETMGSHSWEPRWHWHCHCHPAPPPRELLLGNSQPPDALRLLESGWTHFNHFLH